MKYNQEHLLNAFTRIFEFTAEEDDAIIGFIPMTQDIFNSCIQKCLKYTKNTGPTFQKLIRSYPDFWNNCPYYNHSESE